MFRTVFRLTILAFVVFNGCNSDDNYTDSAKLHSLITNGIQGDNNAIAALKGLLDTKHFRRNDFNNILIDSGYFNKKYYYSVLLEYFDPMLNRLAIYDNSFKIYLLDKSLNGNLSAQWAVKDNRNLLFVQERFLTKDVLSIDRLSIYEVFNSSASLIYRSLSRFVKDRDTSYQTIEQISGDKIVTKLKTVSKSKTPAKSDTFYFSSTGKKYLSIDNIFNSFVKQEIKDFRWIITKPQISADLFSDSENLDNEQYQISLNNSWEKMPGYSEDKLFKQSLIGTRYSNKNLKTFITIFELPEGKTGEDYSFYDFGKPSSGTYKIRYTDRYTINMNYYQIVEHSCGSKKFLLMFECPQSIYSRNEVLFDTIIKSFIVNC